MSGPRKHYNREYYLQNSEKIKARSKAYRDSHKEELKVWRKEYAIRCPDVRAKGYRRYNLRKDFGITPEEYDVMLIKQVGRCYLCPREAMNNRRLGVDHNHTTGKVRKLLCQQCNSLIGMAHEDIGVLQRAIAYLKEHE